MAEKKHKDRSENSDKKVEKSSKKGRRVVKVKSSSKPKAPVPTPAERGARKREFGAAQRKRINCTIDMMRLQVPGCINVPDKVKVV